MTAIPVEKRKKIVILGAGFGGIYTYLALKKSAIAKNLSITFISQHNYFLFTPLLHEVATGGLSQNNVVESVRKIISQSHTNFYQTTVDHIAFDERAVHTPLGAVPYDYLVIALGARTNFCNVSGAENHTFVLKDLADAIRLRNHFIDTFETASKLPAGLPRKRALTFVVAGGGATGVELSAEMAEFFFDTFSRFYKNDAAFEEKEASIHLVHNGPELLERFPKTLRVKAQQALAEKRVVLHVNTSITKVTDKGITLSDDSFIPTSNVIWTAGVCPSLPSYSGTLPLTDAGRIETDRMFAVHGLQNVYAIGDIAAVSSASGKPYPMLAQVARQQGFALGKNLIRILKGKAPQPFIYKQKGLLVSLGQGNAVGIVGNTHLSGPLAWFIWRTAYLFNFASWANRVKIAIDWTVDLFDSRDITKA